MNRPELTNVTKTTVTPTALKKVLRERFGLESLRDGQAEVIQSVLDGHHTLSIMPTGAGKSLCFQLPALLIPGTTIVVSPLIALMKDQKEKLDRLEISTIEINSTLTTKEQTENVETVTEGQTEFVYVTPERLVSEDFLKSMDSLEIDLMVIDEAHCVSQWGHDFRPAYLSLRDAWKRLREPRILALTATATKSVVEDICKQLGVPDMRIFSSGIMRDNLFYEALHVEKESEKTEKIKELLNEAKGSGIIYCATVRAATDIYEELSALGYPVDLYHGKLSAADRTENRQRFMAADDRIIVATNAFGMGIDKPDIRFIIHFQFPGSLEAYYQESGRAGRDGNPSRCILLYLKKDKSTQSFFLAGKYPRTEQLLALYQSLTLLNARDKKFNEADVVEASKVPKAKVKVMLAAMKHSKIVESRRDGLRLLKHGLIETDLAPVMEGYRLKKEADAEKLKQMIVYAQSAMCRWKLLLRYFDQNVEWQNCGHCDNCVRHGIN